MVILRNVFFLSLFLIFSLEAREGIHLICTPSELCKDILSKYDEISRQEKSGEALIERVKDFSLDSSIRLFHVYKKKGHRIIVVEKKPLVKRVQFFADDEIDLEKVLRISQLQEGLSFEMKDLLRAKKKIDNWLRDEGYLGGKVNFKLQEKDKGELFIFGYLEFRKKMILKDLFLEGEKSVFLKEKIKRLFRREKGKVYSRTRFRSYIESITSELRKVGHLNARLRVGEEGREDLKVVRIHSYLGKRVQFSFYGNQRIGRDEFISSIQKSFDEGAVSLRGSDLSSLIKKKYLNKGVYNTQVDYYKRTSQTLIGDDVETFFFKIREGHQVQLDSLDFKGNIFMMSSTLREIFYKNASALSSRNFIDEKYLENFTNILKDYYLQRGFVFIDVSRPRLVFNKEKRTANVSYFIKERQQSLVKKIKLEGLPEKHWPKVYGALRNKINHPLNILELESDLVRALNVLREMGYFYSSILNIDDDDVVTYNRNYTHSFLTLKFNLGKVTRFENLVLSGNRVTKDKVLRREIHLKKGETITPEKLKRIRDNINSLGLFARVQVIPIVINKLSEDEDNRINMILKVQEKKFGRGEIAPGYRTDIGAKLSVVLTKGNLLGLNDSGTFKFQLNRRFGLSQFDSRRAGSGKQRIEGLAKINYSFPYIFSFADFLGGFSIQRKRFYAFDADIVRISPELTKQLTRSFGATLKYQYERIRQFDATHEKDKATFEIGSLMPGVSFDFRDNKISPRSGAYFALSWELATPYFGSQKDEEIEINFLKFVSRNKFYIPLFSKKIVWALSLSMGVQENFARELRLNDKGVLQSIGYIPSIKVFRLDGYDGVRGYSDSEVNRLGDGDITEKRIENKAYFINFKMEPRYYASETFVVAPFFDAGRLYVNKFEPLKLRTSVGLSFKILTPVGTLDFDYGVKLQRENITSTEKESFGRFHLSIGYF